MEDNERYLAETGTDKEWEKRDTKCWYHRQSIREDYGKRGICGYDAAKKVKGRKRHILVDTNGLLLKVVVHAADIQDRDGAKLVLKSITDDYPRLLLVWADQAYGGKLQKWTRKNGKCVLEVVKKEEGVRTFIVLPRRWVVERTFAWLGRYRRLSKDYEYLTETAEAMIYAAMARLMLKRLAS